MKRAKNQFFPDEIRKAGYNARVILNSMDYVLPDEIVCEHLKIDSQDKVMRLEKLFFADDTPFIYLNTYLTQKSIDFAVKNGIKLPAIGKIENYESSKLSVEAVFPNPTVSEKLHITTETPVLRFLVDGYDQESKPVMFSEEFCVNGVVDFTAFQRITPDKKSVPICFTHRSSAWYLRP